MVKKLTSEVVIIGWAVHTHRTDGRPHSFHYNICSSLGPQLLLSIHQFAYLASNHIAS